MRFRGDTLLKHGVADHLLRDLCQDPNLPEIDSQTSLYLGDIDRGYFRYCDSERYVNRQTFFFIGKPGRSSIQIQYFNT